MCDSGIQERRDSCRYDCGRHQTGFLAMDLTVSATDRAEGKEIKDRRGPERRGQEDKEDPP